MTGMVAQGPEAGWYPDPSGRASTRYWSGSRWTPWVVSDGEVVSEEAGLARRLDSHDIGHLAFIDEVFIPRARRQGVIDGEAAGHLTSLVARLIEEAHEASLTAESAARPAPALLDEDAGDLGRQPSVPPRPVEPMVAAPGEPVVSEPGPFRRWWTRSRQSIGSDLAVHGLAYLGVLLLFVGAFGLVAFAFGGVEPAWRPVAELAIAAVPFATAALLLRRGATIVGRSLELAGGLLLPVMVMTVFLDDVPPDLDGAAMVVGMTAALLVIAGAYAAWSRRHADSALRFVAAPLVWLAAGLAAMGVGREMPAGAAVASLTAAQVTAVALALAATLVVARLRQDDRVAAATLTSGVPGAVVVAVMAGLTWLAEDFPPVPVLLTGIAGVIVVDLLDRRVPSTVVAVVQPVWWAVVSAGLLVSGDPGPAGAVAAVGFGLLLEREARRHTGRLPLALSVTGLLVAFVATIERPWYGVGLALVGSVWACWRRLRPIETGETPSTTLLDLGAAVAPFAGLLWLGAATETVVVPVAVGSCLVLLAASIAVAGLLRRDDSDRFWMMTWPSLAAFVTAALAAAWALGTDPDSLTWLLPGSAVVLTAAAGIGPMPAVARPWAVLGFGTLAWVLLGVETALSAEVVAVVVAGVALAVVVAAHMSPSTGDAGVAGSMAVAGHVLGLGAALAASGGVALTVAAGAATAGFAVTSIADVYEQSPLVGLGSGTARLAHYVAPTLAAIGLPITAAAAMDASGVSWSDDWPLTTLLAVTALGYALLARAPLPDAPRRSVAGVASVAAVLVAATASDRQTALVALSVLAATVWALPVALRITPMVWLGWASIAPLAGLLAREISAQAAASPAAEIAATALVGVGGVLALAGLAVDRASGHGAQWRLRRPELYPVVITGSAEVLAGLALAAVAVSAPASGWLMLVGAAAVLGAAVLHRMGVLAGVAALLAWIAAVVLAGETVLDRTWAPLVVTAALVILADAARTLQRPQWWARWDVSLFVAAHLVAATGLLAAIDTESRPVVLSVVGGLALSVAARLREHRDVAVPYAVGGLMLVLLGAADAGPGWMSLTMLLIAASCVVVAGRRDEGPGRWLPQTVGAAAAALSWQQATVWLELPVQRAVDLSALGVGGLVLTLAVAFAMRSSVRSWLFTWGGVGTLLGAAVGLAALAEFEVAVSPSTLVGGGLLVLAWVAAAEVMDVTGLRYGAVVLLALVEAEVLGLVGATPATQVVVLATTAGVAALLALAPVMLANLAAWQRPVLALGVVSALGSIGVAVGQLPDRTLLVPSLLVAAGVSAGAGVALSSVWVRVLSPLLACAAWVVFAAESLGDNPQWYMVPMGLALLVAVALLRQDARDRGADPSAAAIVTLEVVGIAFLVGASFVQAVTDSLVYIALAVVLGAAVAAWGLLTKVRRRVVAGSAVVLAAVVVLLAVPLVSLLPAWQSTALWIFLAGAGLVALLAATAIEKGRLAVHKAMERYVALGDEWE